MYPSLNSCYVYEANTTIIDCNINQPDASVVKEDNIRNESVQRLCYVRNTQL